MPDTGTDEGSVAVRVPDPETAVERESVAVRERTRTFEAEQFDALRKRYDRIAGVVMVGVVDDGAVLLQGTGEWYPPGGEVDPGQDWAVAARESLESLTGVPIAIGEPVLVEFSEFRRAGEGSESFPATAVHFRASLAGDAADSIVAFRENPTVAEDFDHPAFDPEDVDLGWFESVPDDVNENHAEHVRLFVG